MSSSLDISEDATLDAGEDSENFDSNPFIQDSVELKQENIDEGTDISTDNPFVVFVNSNEDSTPHVRAHAPSMSILFGERTLPTNMNDSSEEEAKEAEDVKLPTLPRDETDQSTNHNTINNSSSNTEKDTSDENRLTIVSKLLDTEKEYLHKLKDIVSHYLIPLRSLVGAKNQLMTGEQLFLVFSDLESMINTHTRFSNNLKKDIDNWNKKTTIVGKTFTKIIPSLNLYHAYTEGLPEAIKTLNDIKHTNPEFKKFLATAKRNMGTDSDINDLLSLPTDRIPRYRITLQKLLEATPEGHDDYQAILQAMMELKDVDMAIIKSKRHTTKLDDQMTELDKIQDLPHDLQLPTRKILKSGEVHKITSKFVTPIVLFLFDHLLLQAAPLENASLRYKGVVYLGTSWVRDLPDTRAVQNAFQVVAENKTYTYFCDTLKEKADWMEKMQSVINELIKKDPGLMHKRSFDIKLSSNKNMLTRYITQLNPLSIKPENFDPYHEGTPEKNNTVNSNAQNENAETDNGEEKKSIFKSLSIKPLPKPKIIQKQSNTTTSSSSSTTNQATTPTKAPEDAATGNEDIASSPPGLKKGLPSLRSISSLVHKASQQITTSMKKSTSTHNVAESQINPDTSQPQPTSQTTNVQPQTTSTTATTTTITTTVPEQQENNDEGDALVESIGVFGLELGINVVNSLNKPIQGTKRMRVAKVRAVAGWDYKESLLKKHSDLSTQGITLTDNFADLLSSPDISMAAIYTRDPERRFNLVLMCSKMGKNVILEHPLITSVDQGRLLLNFMSTTKVQSQLRVVQISQVFPSFVRQHKDFRNNLIGELEMLDASFVGFIPFDEENKVNENFRPLEGLSHVVTIMRCFMKNIDEVHAVGSVSAISQSLGLKAFDVFSVNCTTKKGLIAKLVVHCSQRKPAGEPELKCILYGSKGVSVATYPDMVYTYQTGDQVDRNDLNTADNSEFYFNKEKNQKIPYGCYANYISHFNKTISTNTNSYEVNVQQGIQTYAIVEAILRSASQRKPIKVKDVKSELSLEK
eukprot:TRINITY_DN6970_c0_g1_i1.p1 TRINITY_DN6970_c0_g1~~TRINITY_DN6970_c0_g1_i1.p1  ORF type:complete len:1033 (-),score=263.11 TRINITY_DN6970_c0_g1_i1:220-3318(-)